MTDPVFTFRPLRAVDLPLVRGWLAAPHVRRWWQEHWTDALFDGIERGEAAPGDTDPFVVDLDGRPVGYVHATWALRDPSGFWTGIEGVTEAPRGIDFLIGDVGLVNRKLSRAMLRAFVSTLFEDPAVDRIVADPQRNNWPANIVLKRVGFRDRGRIDRPGVNAMLLTLARGVFKP
jgi:RimJ/RimL family protein N-acetyltransferase